MFPFRYLRVDVKGINGEDKKDGRKVIIKVEEKVDHIQAQVHQVLIHDKIQLIKIKWLRSMIKR